MRALLSKRGKSPKVSPPATSKLSRKLKSSPSAKAPPRPKQKTAIKSVPAKSALKPISDKKNQSKVVASKKSSSEKVKHAVSPVGKTVVSRKLSAQTGVKLNPTGRTTKATKSKVPTTAKTKAPTPSPRTSRVVSKVVSSPKIPRQQTAGQALRAFEQAVKAFNLRQFSEAKTLFEELQQRYHQEVEIIARSQTYIQVCNVRLAANRSLPRNADEFYDRGVVALNVGNFAQARTFFEKALKLRPDDSHTLYSLAATHAQIGATDKALSYLQQAVQRQPRLRQQALQDTDFSVLQDDRRFLELLGATSPFDLLESRREIS